MGARTGFLMLAPVGAQQTNHCSTGSRQQTHSSVQSEPPLPSLTVTLGLQPHSHCCSFSRSSSKTRHSTKYGWKGQSLSQKHHCGLASTCPPCKTYQMGKRKPCRGRWGANYIFFLKKRAIRKAASRCSACLTNWEWVDITCSLVLNACTMKVFNLSFYWSLASNGAETAILQRALHLFPRGVSCPHEFTFPSNPETKDINRNAFWLLSEAREAKESKEEK